MQNSDSNDRASTVLDEEEYTRPSDENEVGNYYKIITFLIDISLIYL
jgi:hypothetical protein